MRVDCPMLLLPTAAFCTACEYDLHRSIILFCHLYWVHLLHIALSEWPRVPSKIGTHTSCHDGVSVLWSNCVLLAHTVLQDHLWGDCVSWHQLFNVEADCFLSYIFLSLGAAFYVNQYHLLYPFSFCTVIVTQPLADVKLFSNRC